VKEKQLTQRFMRYTVYDYHLSPSRGRLNTDKRHFKRQESFLTDYIRYMIIQYIFGTCHLVLQFEDAVLFGAFTENEITGVS